MLLRKLTDELAVLAGWLVLATAIFGGWEWAVRDGRLDPVYVGQPSKIFVLFLEMLSTPVITVDAVSTFTGALVGWAAASIAGVVVTLLLSRSRYLTRVVDPFFTALNSLPRVALAPLILLWFGIGMSSKVALSFSLAFFVVASNTRAGVESAEADRLLLARVLGATNLQTFLKFILPGAVPNIITGLQLGFIFGMLATVAGEMIAGQSGLGVRLQYFASAFRMNEYFATLVILVVGTTAFSGLLSILRRHLLRWQLTELGRAH
jgi:NitT/TauT family transport system permease protein